MLISSRRLFTALFCSLSLNLCDPALATEAGFGFRLIIFDKSNPAYPEITTGHINSREHVHVPSGMQQTLDEAGIHITCFTPYGQEDKFHLLAFYREEKPWQTQYPAVDITAQTKEYLEQYRMSAPWGVRSWLSAFICEPTAALNKVSLVASSADAETAAENSVIQLDNISLLSRWVLKESDNSTSFSRALLEQAKTTLQLLVCPELGGICTPRFVDVMALHIESSLGFNVLSMCMRAAAALERPDLIDWIMEKGHTKTLEALVTAVAADKLNPLHLSLLKFPCCFERLLAAYPDESRRLQAIEKTFDGFNLLMMAVTECPEQVTALLRYIPDSQRQLLFLDLLVDGRWNHNLLEQAINVHPKNTELVRILLDACPDDETRTSLITRTPPDDRGPVIMAARRNSETLKLLFEQCPISEHPRLLKIKTSYGDNVLITASCSSPNAISTILDASPDNATTSELLTEQGYLGLNAILCAIENAPQYVSVLLQAAPNEHTLTTMLTTQDQDKDNAINLSFGYCPENIDMLMNACTNKTVLSQVLTTQNNKGQNALHRAILCRKPEFVSRVLAASPDDITTHTLLTAQDDAGNNALILAIWYGYPELVSVLLSACPDSTTIAKHVETVADGSANALMSAAQYAPEVMGALIQSGQKNCQQTLLLTQNHKGNNALIIAEAMAETYNYSPAIIETLLHASHTTETKHRC